jgi:hypothetical protein
MPLHWSAQKYTEQIATPAAFWPDHSPQCQAERPLIAHGFSSRTLMKAAFDGSIRVHRCLCRFCGRTVLLLLKLFLS